MDEDDPTVFLSANAFDSSDVTDAPLVLSTEGLVDIPATWGVPDAFDRKFLPFY